MFYYDSVWAINLANFIKADVPYFSLLQLTFCLSWWASDQLTKGSRFKSEIISKIFIWDSHVYCVKEVFKIVFVLWSDLLHIILTIQVAVNP